MVRCLRSEIECYFSQRSNTWGAFHERVQLESRLLISASKLTYTFFLRFCVQDISEDRRDLLPKVNTEMRLKYRKELSDRLVKVKFVIFDLFYDPITEKPSFWMIRLEVGRNDREKLLPEKRKIIGKEVQNVYGNCKGPKIRILRLNNILIDYIFIIRFWRNIGIDSKKVRQNRSRKFRRPEIRNLRIK